MRNRPEEVRGPEPRVRFHTGWRRTFKRLPLAIRAVHYLIHPGEFPNFRLRASRNGLRRSLRVEKELGLTKLIEFDGSYFSSLTIPRFPSAAYDRAAARGGLNIMAAGTPDKNYIDNVIIGITRQCTYGCRHCYERRNIAPEDTVPVSRWIEAVRGLQDLGAGIIIFSGGEPMLRFGAVVEILEASDHSCSDFHLHTSGEGVTRERAERLKAAGLAAAAVGLDDVDPERFDDLRGSRGAFDRAVAALMTFRDAGIFTYVNVCLTRELVRSGDLWRHYQLLHDLGVGMAQLLEPRPCGGFAGRPMETMFDEEDRSIVAEMVRRGNSERRFSAYPALYYVAHMEHPSRMGCMMGGLSHFTIDSAGNVNPCVFVPVSFGNILEEDVRTIVGRMRGAIPSPIRRECPSILLADRIGDRSGGTLRYEDVREEWRACLSDAYTVEA